MGKTMDGGTTKPIRAGGQALADGVLMRTERAWAIARIDGTVEVGAVPENPWAAIPVLRVLRGLGGALKLGIGRGMLRRGAGGGERVARSRRANGRFLIALLGAEAVVALLGFWLQQFDLPRWGTALLTLLPWIAVLSVMRLATVPALWRFHGAEHKAVAAHERGVDLVDTDAVLACPRVHDRCGTNLVFLLALSSLAIATVPTAVQVPMFVMMLGATVELVSLAARRPRFFGSRALLSGGKLLQRAITTAEPTPEEQVVACRSLSAALAEHARLDALDGDPAVLVAA
jgi:uncharacterized protein YqhQ